MKPDRVPQTFHQRRDLLRAMAVGGFALGGCATAGGKPEAGEHHDEAEVTPGEDLMQEHGVLERILLIYDEAARRIERQEKLDLTVVGGAAEIVRRFVEEYHEKLEEQFVFPRLEAAGRERELVAVLRRQHERGRALTAEVARLAAAGAGTPQLVQLLRSFQRMYRPHAAREDTVLFPAFRGVVGGPAYRELGEQFEEKEHSQFGEDGFEKTVATISGLEATLGIADLAAFTPA